MDELARLLTVERRLLERLLGTLHRRGRVTAADLEELQLTQLQRWLVVDELAGALGLTGDSPTLPALIRRSEGPLRTALVDHHAALTGLALRVELASGPAGCPMPALTDFLGPTDFLG